MAATTSRGRCTGEVPMDIGSCDAGAGDFFTFYSQLQQSCIYYSNLALRQMMVGYQNPVRIGSRDATLLAPPVVNEDDIDRNDGSTSANVEAPLSARRNLFGPSTASAFRTPQKAPTVRVVVSGCDTDNDNESSSAGMYETLRPRKVNFATPLSTIKIKSPTPLHSMDELYVMGYADNSKTGFTSDSDETGSETDILCDYMRRIQNAEQQQQLQIPPGNTQAGGANGNKKRKKRRKKNKNKNKGAKVADTHDEDIDDDYNFQSYWPLGSAEDYFDDDDDLNVVPVKIKMKQKTNLLKEGVLKYILEHSINAAVKKFKLRRNLIKSWKSKSERKGSVKSPGPDIKQPTYEVPLNEEDYEFVSEIRLCGAPKESDSNFISNSGEEGLVANWNEATNVRSEELKFLYGESGSSRILKMEDTIDQIFAQTAKKVKGRKY